MEFRTTFFVLIFVICTAGSKDSNVPTVFDVSSVTELFHVNANSFTTARDKDRYKLKRSNVTLNSNYKLNLRRILVEGDEEIYSLNVDDCRPVSCNTSRYLFTKKSGVIGPVYAKLSEVKQENDYHWSPALALLLLLQNDEAFIKRDIIFAKTKIDDHKYGRTFGTDQIGKQQSILPVSSNDVKYVQKATYTHRNSIVERIDVEESVELEASHFKLLQAKSRTVFDGKIVPFMDGNSMIDIDCKHSNTVKECIDSVLKSGKYQLISEAIEKYFDEMLKYRFKMSAKETKKDNQRKCRLFTAAQLRRMTSFSRSTSALSFLDIWNKLADIDTDHVGQCLNEFKNSGLMHSALSILALTGKYTAYEQVKSKFSKLNDLSLWNIYLSALPYGLHVEAAVVDDLMGIVREHEEPSVTVILSTSSILHRHKNTISNNGESEKWNRFVQVFVEKLKKCQSDTCSSTWLYSLQNLRDPVLLPFIGENLCTLFKFDRYLLKVLRLISIEKWNDDEIRQLLYRIYANRCPTPKDQTSRMMAAELLLSSTPETMLNNFVLGMISAVNEKTAYGREMLSALLSSINQRSLYDPKFRSVRTELRRKRYFNEFLSFLSYGQSMTTDQSISVFGHCEPFSHLNVEFGGGLLKRVEADTGLLTNSGELTTVAGIELYSDGMSTIMSLIGSNSGPSFSNESLPSSDDQDWADSLPLTAGLRFTFFDHALEPIVFFNGETELMGAVWSAGGEPAVLFNNTFLLNDFQLRLPAASGALFSVDLKSALSLYIDGSAEVSIWYRSLKAALNARGSLASVGRFQISSGQSDLLSHDLEFTLEFGSSLLTNVDFYQTPTKLCFQIEQTPVNFKLKSKKGSKLLNISLNALNSVEKQRRFEGTCLNLGHRISYSCSTMYD